jgi:outer membrane lipoprotein SlyB
MRDSTNFGSAFERVATYMAEIVLSSIFGFTLGVISGAVVAGLRGSLIGGILGALLAPWFAGRFLIPFSR